MSRRRPRSVPLMLTGFLALLDLSIWLPGAAFVLESLALATLIVAVLVAAQTVPGATGVSPGRGAAPADAGQSSRSGSAGRLLGSRADL